jgi:hypothetical protein
LLTIAFLSFFISSCRKNVPAFCDCNPADITATVSVYASGLNNPRGLKFGPDGNLYVAEGGYGGTDSTIGQCTQVPTAGPYFGSYTGSRISRIGAWGNRTTVVNNILSIQTNAAQGNLVSGVADVAFVGNSLYGILAGAGCSHGVPGIPNGVIKAGHDQTWAIFADLSAYQMANRTEPGTA